jgi:predicted Rossmann-fold nucleotide-binding protein
VTEGPSPDDGFVLVPPESLYTTEDLYGAFDEADELSLARTLDFRAYLATVAQGQRVARSSGVAAARALHDSAITHELSAQVVGSRPVGIMGGHGEPRGSGTYEPIARLAHELTKNNYLVLTGGGPGSMEAAHLGARFGLSGSDALEAALTRIASDQSTRRFPLSNQDELVVDGRFSESALRKLHHWMAPAMQLARESQGNAGASIGIPTWLYGHEPCTPFAALHAKYFENSIREDGLLALATYGVIYAPGSAGTIQEVFEDANQNYYAPRNEGKSPMVFLDIDGWWSRRFPVIPVLKGIFGDDYASFIELVTTPEDAVAAIEAHAADVSDWAEKATDRKLRT